MLPVMASRGGSLVLIGRSLGNSGATDESRAMVHLSMSHVYFENSRRRKIQICTHKSRFRIGCVVSSSTTSVTPRHVLRLCEFTSSPQLCVLIWELFLH
mmetsp:Transcript_47831/g.71205  ORF Transcript_47831/g.71205 Transcript_47831/m.71205 type:complete len:99 (-) Transcript_47831:5-301(-)